MQLAWGMDEGSAEIRDALTQIGEHLDLAEVFQEVPGGGEGAHTTFSLSSMVCYYGQVRGWGGVGVGGGWMDMSGM